MSENFEIESILIPFLENFKIDYSSSQISFLRKYLDLLYENNKYMNLVGTKDKKGILIRHFLDCLSILKLREVFFGSDLSNIDITTQKIIDIGSGAGLPGILLAIFLQDRHIYLLEKKLRKVNFLTSAVTQLNLKNVEILRGRAEELAHQDNLREKFDLVVARAVTKFDILCELAIPFCKIYGKVVFYKSKKIFEELNKYGDVVPKLGGRILGLEEVRIPNLEEFRAFLIIAKEEKTSNKFPRSVAKIGKKVLK